MLVRLDQPESLCRHYARVVKGLEPLHAAERTDELMIERLAHPAQIVSNVWDNENVSHKFKSCEAHGRRRNLACTRCAVSWALPFAAAVSSCPFCPASCAFCFAASARPIRASVDGSLLLP